MLALALLAFAAVQSAPAPAQPAEIEGSFTVLPGNAGTVSAVIGEVPHFLAVRCTPGARRMEVYASFPETIGFSVRTTNSGGFRVRYRFDGGEERRSDWSAAGEMAVAIGTASAPHDFVRRLRSSRSLLLQVRRQGGGSQQLSFRYPDPAAAIDELSRQCAISLD